MYIVIEFSIPHKSRSKDKPLSFLSLWSSSKPSRLFSLCFG
uniref:Uncharacterized protein n=1 Tax=Utricularia reniformis TaxID=192314 RepID=A0A1Y0AZY1_9LAMI|nr:hypothetical protein AEK19_MT0478 [Utricularia reniformis]ART30735.1 hypothetical protein AEK19_MT0478 [Utricularia reniformis]